MTHDRDAVTAPPAPSPPPERRLTAWFTDRDWSATLAPSRLAHSRAVGRGVRVAILLPAVMGVLILAGQGEASFLAGFAVVVLLVTSDFSGPRRERATAMAVVAAAGAITMTIGILLNGTVVLLIVTALVLGVLVALFGVLRGFLSQATVPVLLPFFLAATTKLPPYPIPHMVGGWLFGSACSIIAAVTMWPYFPRRTLTASVVTSMRAEAALIDDMWTPGAQQSDVEVAYGEVESAVERTQAVYAGQLKRPGSAFRRERFLVRLVEETRRLRLGLRMAWRQLPLDPSSADREVMDLASESMRHAAEAAEQQVGDLAPFYDLDAARDGHRSAVVAQIGADLSAGKADAVKRRAIAAFRPRVISLQSLTVVRDAGLISAGNVEVPHISLRGRRLPTVLQTLDPKSRLRAELNWSAPWMRNALRLGIAVALATLVVHFTGAARGYWVVLGTLSVLRMDVRGTSKTIWKVIQGQILGFLLGGMLVYAVDGRPGLAWTLLPLVAGLVGFASGNLSIIWQQAGFTVLLVNLIAISQPVRGITLLRLEDVGLGVVVAITVSLLVFPRGLVPQVRDNLCDAVDAAAEFLVHAVELVGHRISGEATSSTPLTGEHARNRLERAAETIDLSLAQGVPQNARTLLWWRVQAVIEYIIYIAEITSTVGGTYPRQRPAASVAGDLIKLAHKLRPQLEEDARQLLAAADRADEADLQGLPDYPNTGDYSPEVRAASRSISAEVDGWAAEHRVEMADPVVELYWTLGWLGELDLILANNASLLAALNAELAGMKKAAAAGSTPATAA